MTDARPTTSRAGTTAISRAIGFTRPTTADPVLPRSGRMRTLAPQDQHCAHARSAVRTVQLTVRTRTRPVRTPRSPRNSAVRTPCSAMFTGAAPSRPVNSHDSEARARQSIHDRPRPVSLVLGHRQSEQVLGHPLGSETELLGNVAHRHPLPTQPGEHFTQHL